MARKPATKIVQKKFCKCGSMITMVAWHEDNTVLIPVDTAPGKNGDITTTVVGGTLVARFVDNQEASLRAHWNVCPYQSQWHATMEKTGHRKAHEANRAGPCSRCGALNPYRYGGPIASPLCGECRKARGLEPIY